jgi:hypothetical protein
MRTTVRLEMPMKKPAADPGAGSTLILQNSCDDGNKPVVICPSCQFLFRKTDRIDTAMSREVKKSADLFGAAG